MITLGGGKKRETGREYKVSFWGANDPFVDFGAGYITVFALWNTVSCTLCMVCIFLCRYVILHNNNNNNKEQRTKNNKDTSEKQLLGFPNVIGTVMDELSNELY